MNQKQTEVGVQIYKSTTKPRSDLTCTQNIIKNCNVNVAVQSD